jgi:hypothetical protein
VQAIALGDIADLNQGRTIVKNSFDVKRYEAKDLAAWDEAYARFQKILNRE